MNKKKPATVKRQHRLFYGLQTHHEDTTFFFDVQGSEITNSKENFREVKK